MRVHWVLVALLGLAGARASAIVGGGEVTFKVKGAENVAFSHDAHVSKANLGCRECHAKLYLDARHHQPVTMKAMESKRVSCGACHDGTRAFAVADCARCHK